MTKALIEKNIQESLEVKKRLFSLTEEILKGGFLLADTLEKGKKILFCGNGGSAADAQHIAAELIVRFKKGNERRALPAIAISSMDPSTITACSNDYSYEDTLARIVEALGEEGDTLVGISTSGNSENILRAIKKAREKNMRILLLLGGEGGKMKGKGDVEIIVPSSTTARIQECHILIGHILCSIIEKKLFNLD